MSRETIIRRIRQDAEAEVQALMESAQEEAGTARAAAAAEAEQVRERAVIAGKKAVDLEIARIYAQANLDAREILRHAREEMIRECFHAADQELARVRETAAYPAILGHLISNATEQVGGNQVVISAARRDHALVREYIRARGASSPEIRISGEDVATLGGVIVRSGTGHVAVNNTFEERLGQMRNELVFELARFLSSGSGGA